MAVEWKILNDVCSVHTGMQLNRDDMLEEGMYPVMNGGRTSSGYTNTANEKANSITISQGGESAGFVNWLDKDFWAGAHCYVLCDYKIEKRFLYHLLKSREEQIRARRQGAGIPGLNRNALMRLPIPTPSPDEQKKLVYELDSFTELISKLNEEIGLRKKQLELYKEDLFDAILAEKFNRKIGDLFVFKNGLNKEKSFFGKGTPIINYTDVYYNNSLTKETIEGKVTLNKKEIERYQVYRGDVFFTRTSETPDEVGLAAVLLDEIENCTFSGFLLRARPTTDVVLPEYCKYCFSTNRVRGLIKRYSTYTTRALTNGTSLSKIDIPVPPKDEQLRIVSILDTFTSLISKLEAERDLRQKQYEYYRNKLLTFE